MLGSEEEANKMMVIFTFYLPVQDEFEEFGIQLSGGVQEACGSKVCHREERSGLEKCGWALPA